MRLSMSPSRLPNGRTISLNSRIGPPANKRGNNEASELYTAPKGFSLRTQKSIHSFVILALTPLHGYVGET